MGITSEQEANEGTTKSEETQSNNTKIHHFATDTKLLLQQNMKILLAVLTITSLGFASGTIQCNSDQVSLADGCVPAPPTGDPECKAECPPSQACNILEQQIYVYDFTSQFIRKEDCGYRYERTCRPKRDIVQCDTVDVTINSVCDVTCENVTIHDCFPATREIDELETEKECTTIIKKECLSKWVSKPCQHNSDELCNVYECTGTYIDVPQLDCKQVPKIVKRTVPYEECQDREVMVCEENDAKAITYQKLENCKRSVLDDCYDKLVPEICPEEHQLRPHIFALNITVAMCDAGFMSDPYFYDHCESSRCRVTTKEVYDDYVLNQALA